MLVSTDTSAKQFFHKTLAKKQEWYIWGSWSETTIILGLEFSLKSLDFPSGYYVNSDPLVFLDMSF